jgi:hypothetical protein
MTAGWDQKPEMEAATGDDEARAEDDGFMIFCVPHDPALRAKREGHSALRAQRLARDRFAVSYGHNPLPLGGGGYVRSIPEPRSEKDGYAFNRFG